MVYKLGKYKKNDPMSELVCENYPVLPVMSRFGISLGFGDKTIDEVCKESNVDSETFLAVVNLLLGDDFSETADGQFSIEAIVQYLHNSHDYFLNFRFPAIRRNLIAALDCAQRDVAFAILCFFDEYTTEVRKHMSYEEHKVFPYVRDLLEGKELSADYNIDIFSRQHDSVEMKLVELKNILIKYYPATGTNELNTVLFDIFTCEQDLASHNHIEDTLFVPAIKRLEQNRTVMP